MHNKIWFYRGKTKTHKGRQTGTLDREINFRFYPPSHSHERWKTNQWITSGLFQHENHSAKRKCLHNPPWLERLSKLEKPKIESVVEVFNCFCSIR
jgi:hypothetical protein